MICRFGFNRAGFKIQTMHRSRPIARASKIKRPMRSVTPARRAQTFTSTTNEDTDIKAYQSVAIPNADIFIVGPSGGDLGSTAIPNSDFTSHVAAFVNAQPDND